MPKPDPALLDPDRYPFRCEMTTRFTDLDHNQHVNNVAITSYAEDLRVRFNLAIGCRRHLLELGLQTMIVSLQVEFVGESFYPAPIVGHAATGQVGRTSWETLGLMTQDDRVAAFVRAVLVCVADRRPVTLPDDVRVVLEGHRLG